MAVKEATVDVLNPGEDEEKEKNEDQRKQKTF